MAASMIRLSQDSANPPLSDLRGTDITNPKLYASILKTIKSFLLNLPQDRSCSKTVLIYCKENTPWQIKLSVVKGKLLSDQNALPESPQTYYFQRPVNAPEVNSAPVITEFEDSDPLHRLRCAEKIPTTARLEFSSFQKTDDTTLTEDVENSTVENVETTTSDMYTTSRHLDLNEQLHEKMKQEIRNHLSAKTTETATPYLAVLGTLACGTLIALAWIVTEL